MPTDLDKLNIQTIRGDIGRYRNLFHHRSVILEGIRKVAYRNMAHAIDTITVLEESGVTKDDPDWAKQILSKMLADQGEEDDEPNRLLLWFATYYSMQVYLALLYAEVEFYQEQCRMSGVTRDSDLDSYLDKVADFTDALHSVRDVFLHPLKGHVMTLQGFAEASRSFSLAYELQNELDKYLIRLQGQLANRAKWLLQQLPIDQRALVLLGYARRNGPRMAAYGDREGLAGLEELTEEILEMMEQPGVEFDASWTFSTTQRKTAGILSSSLNDLHPAANEGQSTPLLTVQTRMDWGFLSESVGGTRRPHFGESRIGKRVSQLLPSISNVILASSVLMNESYTIFGEFSHEYLAEFFGDGHDEATWLAFVRKHGIYDRGPQFETELISLSLVGLALAHEPLRIYCSIRGDRPDIFEPRLDGLVERGWLQKIGEFRNSVFHIWDPLRNPPDLGSEGIQEMTSDPYGRANLHWGLASFFSPTPSPEDHDSLA